MPPRLLPRLSFGTGLAFRWTGRRLGAYIALSRPKQWTKCLFVLAPLIFSGRWTDLPSVLIGVTAAALFILASAAVYALNDSADAEADRLHPRKKRRPVASGRIGVVEARQLAAIWGLLAVVGAFLIDIRLGGVVGLYLLANVGYSLALKHQPLIDVLMIAFGFLLRTVGGCLAIGVRPSVWILVCTTCLALFMALVKRRHEVARLGQGEQRPVLSQYPLALLDQLVASMLSTTTMSYLLYCYAVHTSEFMITSLFVLYGLFRYLHLSHLADRTEQPEDAVLADRPLLICALLWGVACLLLAGPVPPQ